MSDTPSPEAAAAARELQSFAAQTFCATGRQWDSTREMAEIIDKHFAELRGSEGRRDWKKSKEAAKLAQRYDLCIMSVPGTRDRRVQAFKKGVFVEAPGWKSLLDALNRMAKSGELD